MQDRDTSPSAGATTYSPAARRFHWWTVLLVAIQIPLGLYMSYRGNVQGLFDATTNFLYSCDYPTKCGGYYLFAHDRSFQSISHYVQNVFPTEAALGESAQVTFIDASGGGNNASGRWASLMGELGFSTHNGGTGG